MSAALGTLPFIATLWLLLVLGSAVLEESGAKIVAALKGKPLQPQSFRQSAVRIRLRSAPGRAIVEPAQWRAAA